MGSPQAPYLEFPPQHFNTVLWAGIFFFLYLSSPPSQSLHLPYPMYTSTMKYRKTEDTGKLNSAELFVPLSRELKESLRGCQACSSVSRLPPDAVVSSLLIPGNLPPLYLNSSCSSFVIVVLL